MTHTNTNPRSYQYLTHAHNISPRQWQPWTAVSALLGPISTWSWCLKECFGPASAVKGRVVHKAFKSYFLSDGYTMLMRPNKTETAVHGCHSPGDMAVRMGEVMARPHSRTQMEYFFWSAPRITTSCQVQHLKEFPSFCARSK